MSSTAMVVEHDQKKKTTNGTSKINTLVFYENQEMIARLQDKLGLSAHEAQILFDDVKKFLFIVATTKGDWAPPTQIDEAWHQFILYTKDYAAFCQSVFGTFIHHTPTSYFGPRQQGGCRRTVAMARSLFGSLSENWDFRDVGDECAPSKPCDASTGGSDGSTGG